MTGSATLPPIPPDRQDGSSSLVHRALILTGDLGRVAPIWLLPAWIALVWFSGLPWRGQANGASLAAGLFFALDWLMLALLPVAQRSWGPVTPPLLALTFVRAGLFWIGAWLWPAYLGIILGLQALLSALAIYATWIEPFQVGVTYQRYPSASKEDTAPLRLLHISDIHFEGLSPRERRVIEHAQQLQPDVILLTGDYLNLSSVYDPAAQQGVRDMLTQLHAPLGIYAVSGSPVVDIAGIVPEIFADLDIRWLTDELVPLPGCDNAWLLGVRCTYDLDRDSAALRELAQQLSPGAFGLLLYHTPDLVPVAAQLGINLYVCGHTHGGQIRLPLYGALATSSRWGKRYEMGRYQEGETTLYVSRGLGLEGLGAPRARLLAPPEIVSWTIGPDFR